MLIGFLPTILLTVEVSSVGAKYTKNIFSQMLIKRQEKIKMNMINNALLKNTINVIVSILLFIAYVDLFGTHSMRKYLEKEIIITEQEDENEGGCGAKQLPGLFIFIHYI